MRMTCIPWMYSQVFSIYFPPRTPMFPQALAARDDTIATCRQECDDVTAAQTAARVEHNHQVKMRAQQQEMLTTELERADAELRDCQDALSAARAECLGLQQKVHPPSVALSCCIRPGTSCG